MGHPNEDLIRRGYDAFSSGDMQTLRELSDRGTAPETVAAAMAAFRPRWPRLYRVEGERARALRP